MPTFFHLFPIEKSFQMLFKLAKPLLRRSRRCFADDGGGRRGNSSSRYGKLLPNTPELLAYCLAMSSPLHPALGLVMFV
jgi:hypothetical protein